MDPRCHIAENPFTRALWFTGGLVALLLGAIGAVLPGLPTTVFLICAAGCFMRSSETFYLAIVEHPIVGPPVSRYLQGHGIPPHVRVIATVAITLSVAASVGWWIPAQLVAARVFVALMGVTGIVFVLSRPIDLGPSQSVEGAVGS